MDPALRALRVRYPALNALEEPTRSVALEAVRRSMDQGMSEAEAVEHALAEAREWLHSRVPGGTTR